MLFSFLKLDLVTLFLCTEALTVLTKARRLSDTEVLLRFEAKDLESFIFLCYLFCNLVKNDIWLQLNFCQ